ncbi:hypothetical protein PtrSN002B_001240 [Pyrenophora tritici-repentis]|uniref:DUF1421 multi-domain protein n=2 Tax=Pyrenophora tritici-repentis TaxID=45151 RepID=A0A2W1I3G9_9PLEO|nr:uncharacterized protein PTRG_00321 [Pyrenophora tritici-repentis Pt-1C-BFP]KAA8624916.1 hypothetical protein PtrV1_00596 [Pyrenophora tritici-repentis]EDU39759.1 predicted protein [Pyrenophora tritici-repentis Pt-1C-BFP]KAF7453311.1 hypothetical protein A1F99_005690 [Pyrenophora tritici-repentis]KAF7576370.1 DUF1421 multi-domain protein [Pyrenophora tritici-repentis]KAG9377240.1 hypothetical protein A1F94_011643 [Pyrenophora tritici-repentis]
MHFTTITLATLLASASAGVVPAVPAIRHDPITKRSEATFDPNGNIKLTFSRETVKIGSLTTEAIISAIYPICHESGQCETNDIDLKGMLITPSRVDAIKVTLGPHGAYPTWIRNGLVDALGAAARTVAKCEKGTHVDKCFGTTAMAYCPQRKIEYQNCEVPKFWGINYQSSKNPDGAPPNLSLDVSMEKEGDGGLCEDVMSGLGAVAGAVHGVGGGVFTLLSFACESK